MEPTNGTTAAAPETYRIGDVNYRLEPASFAQHQWLAEGPLKGIDFSAGLQAADLEPLIQRRGPEILGMVLIADGMTRHAKAEAGPDDAKALGARLALQMTPSEVRDLAHDFFTVDGFQNLWFFIDFPALVARARAEAIAAASNLVSASLPMATAPNAPPLSGSAGRETPNSTSDEAPSAAPSNAPSWVSVA